MTKNSTFSERAGIIQHLEEITRTLETEQFENATTRRWKLIEYINTHVRELKLEGQANEQC